MVEKESVESKPRKIVVEIGSGGNPAPIGASFPLDSDTFYVSVNIDDTKIGALKPSEWDALKFRKSKLEHASAITGDASQLPFANDSIDELIYTNIFSSPGHVNKNVNTTARQHGFNRKYSNPELLLQEAARVLKKGGVINITCTNTPTEAYASLLGMEGGRFKLSDMNRDLLKIKDFSEYHFKVKNFTVDKKSLAQFSRDTFFDEGSFLLTLEKY